MAGEGEWPHHQILRVHRQYAFRQHLQLQEAIPYLMKNKAIPKSLCKEITKFPENNDDNINFLLAYLREAKVERFVRFVEALGESISPTSHTGKPIKSHFILIETMSVALEKISNANMDQVRRVRAVVQYVKTDVTLVEDVGVGTDSTMVESKGELVQVIAGPDKDIPTKESDVLPKTEAETKTEYENTITVIENQSTCTLPTESCKMKYFPGFVEPRLVDFCSRGNIAEGQSAWLIHDPAHGVRIYIPVDAIPPDIMAFAVIMHAYLSGSFEIPDEYDPCTAILILSTDPKLEFLKPVSLKLPHSLVFDGDEEEDDLVILRAKDPNISTHIETQTPVYLFNDVIVSAEFSESYIQVELDHFCGVLGARKKLRYRKSKSTLSLRSLSRQSSVSKQMRSRKFINKMKRKKFPGDSIGSSPQSSYDDSFEKNIPLSQEHSSLLRQNSSIESDEPANRQLKRQVAMEHDDDLSDSPLLQQASSTENTCCNKLYISCFNPVKCTTAWTTRFMVAPNIPTGKLALDYAMKESEKQCRTKMESVFHVAFPLNHFIGFAPDSFNDDDWIVRATTTPQIPLDLIYFSTTQLPHIDFTVESQNKCSSASLHQKITVTGAEAQGSCKQIYFTIKSTDKSVFYTKDGVIFTQSWLYSDNSRLLQVLNNSAKGSDDDNIALNVYSHCTDTAELDCRSADIRKLITDIVLQLPPTSYDDLIIQLELTEYDKSLLICNEKDITERMYKAMFIWITSSHRPNLEELKCVLANLGFHSIKLSSTDVHLVTKYPEVIDQMCKRDMCTKLAPSLGRHWKFVARYLGLDDIFIDGLLNVADREGTEEAAYEMLKKWQQQYFMTATVKTLVRAISRVGQHNSSYMSTAYWCIEKCLCESLS